MKVTLHIEGGPMDGQLFDAEFPHWPPPGLLLGVDIHRDLCGSYERHSMVMAGPTASSAVYHLRDDANYRDIEKHFQRYRIMRRLREPG